MSIGNIHKITEYILAILYTCFVFDMDAKMLCKPDCAGLCDGCGANLNHEKCNCKKPVDPRWAVLEQLLDK